MPRSPAKALTHIGPDGRARMVDVGEKEVTRRAARVGCTVRMSPDAYAALSAGRLEKGDAFAVARVAGIQAAKHTADLIPLCHPLPLDHVELEMSLDSHARAVRIEARTSASARTGIEMEAFTAAAGAALALYDMVKAIDPAACITDLELLEKTGGKAGFRRGEA